MTITTNRPVIRVRAIVNLNIFLLDGGWLILFVTWLVTGRHVNNLPFYVGNSWSNYSIGKLRRSRHINTFFLMWNYELPLWRKMSIVPRHAIANNSGVLSKWALCKNETTSPFISWEPAVTSHLSPMQNNVAAFQQKETETNEMFCFSLQMSFTIMGL